MHKTLLAIVTLGLLSMPLVAPVAAQEGDTVEIILTAVEGGCGDRTYCWETDQSGPFQPGDTLEITVVNPESNRQQHNLYLMNGTPEQEGGGSDGDQAGWNTSDLAPGEEETLTVTVGQSTEELYYWCDIGGHETLGMWDTLTAGQENATGDDGSNGPGGDGDGSDGDGGTDDGDGAQSSPGLGLVAALAGLSLAAWAVARRR